MSPLSLDASPSQWIARTDRATGCEYPGPIRPGELLVHAHRDAHPVDLALHLLGSRLVALTGSEDLTRVAGRLVQRAGRGMAAMAGKLAGDRRVEAWTRSVLGVGGGDEVFRFRDPVDIDDDAVRERIAGLRRDAAKALARTGRPPRLCLLLTGATGFLGKEILAQAVADPHVAEVVCVVRPLTRRGPDGRRRTQSPAARGRELLATLGIHGRRVRFVAGDVEKPGFGLARAEVARLERSVTHLVHCAASVAFDDPYERSYRANVLGSRNALAFGARLQRARGSRFVAYVAIETSYVHGRPGRGRAPEERLSFPSRYYNNYYELTKAMATLETERAMLAGGLRVVQLLPSIVVGHSRTGNNRGDTKVVNAPINAFGRIKEAMDGAAPGAAWLKTRLVGLVGTAFPADSSAELNIVPVDRVAAGVLAALGAPAAVGARIHLATDRRIRAHEMAKIVEQELGIAVRIVDPTLTRTLALPAARALLSRVGERKLADVLGRLGSIFGVYGEWGQPVHSVGNDVKLLALPRRRPDTRDVFRMLCRHNRFVQRFGTVRDPSEIARREELWEDVLDEIEYETGRAPASLSALRFEAELARRIDLRPFVRRSGRLDRAS